MITRVKAQFVYTSVDGDDGDAYVSVGFADDEFDTKEYLSLQKALSSNEQDKESVMNGVYIEYSNQINSAYGGILRVMVQNGIIQFFLDNSTAEKLGTEKQIEVIFPRDIDNLHELVYSLQQMFDGKSVVFEYDI